jgi:hypothetical protein
MNTKSVTSTKEREWGGKEGERTQCKRNKTSQVWNQQPKKKKKKKTQKMGESNK